jgi:thiol:disulfide interchange protein
MEQQLLLWGGFLLFVIAMLALDLGVFHRKAHVIHMREALTWTAVWISLALTFNVGVAYFWGSQAGLEFLTGYLVEKSLSMDNVFVFLLISTTSTPRPATSTRSSSGASSEPFWRGPSSSLLASPCWRPLTGRCTSSGRSSWAPACG